MTERQHRAAGWVATARDPVFVGRERALVQLRTTLDKAIAGTGSLTLLAGEAGIGKTALADRLAVTAAAADVRVWRADCWQGEDQLPYWPLVQLVRPVVAECGWDRLVELLGAEAECLDWLLPERAGASAGDAGSGGAMPLRGGRFRLFDAVTRALVEVAPRRPSLVIVEDLHWADAGVLGFVEFLARQLRDAPMLVVGTYRDVGGEPAEALAAQLPGLLRLGACVELPGLDVHEVASLLRQVTGREPDRAWAERVHRRSGGNPLFAGEVARLMLAGAPHEVPDEVRYVIGQRLAGFPAEVTRLLEMAAVLGVDFDPRELARMAGRSVTRVRAALEQARRQRVLADVDEGHRLRFLHALVRDTLYERIALTDRVDRHRAAGEAILGWPIGQ
ncbi:MAG TPA: AAA family ATPase, partial [Pseudonocardia sp.]|nr:AAA family ATPase [Pseudonocardia sp.]